MNNVKAVIFFFFVLFFNTSIEGQEQEALLLYPDTENHPFGGTYFGTKNAIYGDYAVSVAAGGNSNSNDPLVCFYKREEGGDWQLFQIFDGYDFTSGSPVFSGGIDMDSTTVVIGNVHFRNEGTDTQTGKVYILRFVDNEWVLDDAITPENTNVDSQFGQSVALSGDWLAVGAPKYRDIASGDTTGVVFLYHYSGFGWELDRQIKASMLHNNEGFGFSIDLSNERLLVGSFNGYGESDTLGTAHLFEKNGDEWIETNYFSPEEMDNSVFGIKVALDANTVVVAAPSKDQAGIGGRVYIYEKSQSWSLKQRLESFNLPPGNIFGTDIAIKDNKLLVGAPVYSSLVNPAESGRVFLYLLEGDEWIFHSEMLPDSIQENNLFGSTVSISHDKCIIGDPLYAVEIQTDIPEWVNFGAAYIYDLSEYNVAINEVHSSVSNLRLSPNPTTGNFRISFKSEEKNIQKVQVFDLLGREVFVRDYAGYSSIELETSSWPTGLYIVVVNGVWVEKLVKN